MPKWKFLLFLLIERTVSKAISTSNEKNKKLSVSYQLLRTAALGVIPLIKKKKKNSSFRKKIPWA